MSKILELINDKDSVVVFDIDGVLAKYEFGEHNHNSCSDAEWDADAEHQSELVYSSAKPVRFFQKLILDKRNVYACSVASHGEEKAKKAFIRRHYAIPEENIILVDNKLDKLQALHNIKAKYPDIPDRLVVMIEDTVKTLTYIQENSGYSTCHVSSFLG